MRTLVCAAALLVVVSAASGANLVTNGTFDTDLSGWGKWWSGWGGGTSDVLVDSGVAYHMNLDEQGSTGIFQYVAIPGALIGTQVTLDAVWSGNANNGWAEVLAIPTATADASLGAVQTLLDSGPNVAAAIRVKHEEADWGAGIGEDFSTPRLLSQEGVSILNPLTFTATQPYVLIATKVGNSAFYSIDDITLTPEPASLIMLGLGLPLLRRRR